MATIFRALVGLALASTLQTLPRPINENQPLTVCELLSNARKYEGQIIEVRDEWRGGELAGDCQSLTFDFRIWPALIKLDNPNRAPLPVDWPLPDLGMIDLALTGARAELELLPDAVKRKAKIVATVIGQFEAHPMTDMLSDIPYRYYDIYPARIFIARLRSIDIIADGKVVYPHR